MIGRFLLGAGLGGVVGTGMLALVSVNTPRAMPPLPGAEVGAETPAAPADVAGTPTPSEPPIPEPAAPEEALAEGEVDAPAAVPELPAPEVGEAEAGAAAPEPAAETESTVAAEEPSVPQTMAPAGPAAPAAPEVADAGLAGGTAEGTDRPSAPDTPSAPVAETLPAAPESPAAAPDALALAEPEAPAAPDPVTIPGTAPELEESPAAPQDPAALAVAPSESSPDSVDPPGPPPLTSEEEAMLAEIAKNGPGSALPPGQAAPELAETAPEIMADGGFVLVDPVPEAEAMVPPSPAEDGAVSSPDGPVAPAPVVIRPESSPENAPEDAPGNLPAASPEATPETAPEALPAGDPAPEGAGKRLTVDSGPTLPTVPSLADRDEGTGAGPGADPVPDPSAPAPDPAAEAMLDGQDSDPRPLVRNAAAFENPQAKPLFTVIFIDEGDPALDRDTLADLPFPVSFALDPLAPGASERAAIYRAAGKEVVMLVSGLPPGATAADVEVAFQSMLQALPQAVAVLDLPVPAFQSDRPTAALVVPVVGAEGLGLVTWDLGLNAADQEARRAGIPSTVAFRALDAEGESAPVIRRYLDRAAFKAAQEGRVTVIGTARPETVAALMEWAVEGRAATVALAPVTAVLDGD